MRLFSTTPKVGPIVNQKLFNLLDNAVMPNREIFNKGMKQALAKNLSQVPLLMLEPYKTLTPSNHQMIARIDDEKNSKNICTELFQRLSRAAYAAGEERFQAYQPIPKEVLYFLGPFKTGLSHIAMIKGKADESHFGYGLGLESQEGGGVPFVERNGVKGAELEAALRIVSKEQGYEISGKKAQGELLECAFNTHLLQAFLFHKKIGEFYKEHGLEFDPSQFKTKEFLATQEQIEHVLNSGKLDRLEELTGIAPVALKSMLRESIEEARSLTNTQQLKF